MNEKFICITPLFFHIFFFFLEMSENDIIDDSHFNEDDDLKPIPISNTEEFDFTQKGVPIVFSFIISILIGVMAGSRSHTYREAIIYSAMFLLESFISLVFSNFVPSISFLVATKRISFFLFIQSITTYISWNLPYSVKEYF